MKLKELQQGVLSTSNQRKVGGSSPESFAQQQLNDLVYALSHDVGAPVRHIKAFAKLLGDSLPELDEPQRQWLGFLDDGASLLQAMFNRLLVLSRAMQPVPLESFALTAVAAELQLVWPQDSPVETAPVHLPSLQASLLELRTNARRYGGGDPVERLELDPEEAALRIAIFNRDGALCERRWGEAMKPFGRLGAVCEEHAVGLGLPIAAASAVRGGATLHWHPDGAVLRIPLVKVVAGG